MEKVKRKNVCKVIKVYVHQKEIKNIKGGVDKNASPPK